jgi:TonB-dependent SusC/RagA subfamily outer membrane receptor
MKTKSKIITMFLVASLLCLGFIQLASEDPFMASLRNYIDSFYKDKQWEKVYLHIDKPLYKPGEDIWFKAYVTDGATNKPTQKSDVVYIELINPRGNVDKTLTLQVIQGICFGNFTIDESYNGGLYKIRAYTNWMKNFGTEYYFEKEIQIQKVVYPRLLSKIDFKRESYSPGDTVKAELKIATLENIPLSFKNVKVDFSLAGEKIQSTEIQTNNLGKAMLQFILPSTLKTNDGLINAKVMHEGNMEAISRSIPIVLNKINISFFPEGGYMVAKIPSNVAFKAVNEFGKPAEIEGYITDNSQNKIVEFSSFHQGMGAFGFTPIPGKRYYAVITKPKVDNIFDLPEVMPNGYVMKVETLKNNRYKIVYYSPDKEKVHLTIQSGNKLQYSKSDVTTEGMNETIFSADKFPAGIALVTLFDNGGVPRCERLVYFNYGKRLNVLLKFDKEKYSPREKISLRIRTTDKDSIPVSANLSLAVANDQLLTMADDKQDNILSWLMLGSEIKGKVEKPSFYFDPEEPKAEKALDYLLLTQGWRRYTWNDLLKKNYNILYPAEKVGCISGTIKDKRTGNPVQGEVIVVELQNRKRILKLNTSTLGRFRFENADASSYIQVLARTKEIDINNISIEIDHMNDIAASNKANLVNNRLVPEIIKVKAEVVKEEPKENKRRGEGRVKEVVAIPDGMVANIGGEEVVMEEDVKALEEVVVVGYGVQKKADVTGAIVAVNPQAVKALPAGIEQALQGRASGLNIINDNGQAGLAPQVLIRGTASGTNNQPLYVVDGVVYDPSLSNNASLLQNILPSNIESISVLKDASATAIYGSKASNGVIVVNTKNSYGYYKSVKRNFKPRYAGLLISPRQLTASKEFYYPVYAENDIPSVREDFRPTIYWNPNITTNSAGEAVVEFYASDEITTFRAVAEGISYTGEAGRCETKFYSQLPFSMAVKFPAYLTFGDTIVMPLIIKNNTQKLIKGKLEFTVPKCISPLQTLPDSLSVEAGKTISINIPFFTNSIAGKDELVVNFSGGAFNDAFKQEIDVQAKGFPTSLSVSGKENEKSFNFTINKAIPGSLHAEFTAFPDVLSDLMSGVESILREPYGCFEQTSSSTYPNIMVLSYLKAVDSDNRSASNRATDLIIKGYNRLTSFETSEKGYEWFGGVPAHEGLTAYGLMEFIDMQKVYNGVNDEMVVRTLKWILSQRDGRGGFKRSTEALDQFGRASNEVTRAYIVYALSEAGINHVEQEYAEAYKDAVKSKDLYKLALMANAAYNYKKESEGNELLELISNKLEKSGWNEVSIDHSITMSSGKSLQVETASLYTLALLKAPNEDWVSLEKSISFLVSSRSYGGFGSTQATILALKALSEYAKKSMKTSADGTISITINGVTIPKYSYSKGDKGKIIINGLEKYFRDGENTVSINYLNTNSPLPYTFDAAWNTNTPASDKKCQLFLKTSLSTQNTKVGETVRLKAQLQNISNKGLPMTMAIIGIPSGLSLQPWQLKEIQDKKKVDFYELSKNYLVLYYRQMLPGELREINLDLRAEIAGTYQAPASSTYLYYTNEYKYWTDGEYVKIEN